MKSRKPTSQKAGGSEPARWTPAASLNRDIQAKIGEQLRQMHDDVVREGVPDRFVDLLAKFDPTDTPEASDTPKDK